MNVPESRETRPDRSYVPWYRRMIPRRRTVAVMLALLLATPVGIRWYRLWRMPDVPVPFDVEEFSQMPPVDENAFYYFRQAADRYRPCDVDEAQWYGPDGNICWEQVPENARQWIERQQPALKLFRQGARCDSACSTPAATYTYSTSFTTSGLLSSMRALYRLTDLETAKLMAQGQTVEAAELLHDCYRAMRHFGRRGSIIERLTGMACHAAISSDWRQWSQHPKVTADDIDAALARIRDDWKLTPPMSDQLKMEYFADIDVVNSSLMESRQSLDDWLDKEVGAFTGYRVGPLFRQIDGLIPGWQMPWLWTLGEPEITGRALRLKLTHVLKYCDLTHADLPPLTSGPLRDASELTAGLTAAKLNVGIHQAILGPISASDGFTPEMYLEAIRREAARQALLETSLALQAQFRRRGVASRAEVEQLAAEFPWPVDPCSAESRPLRFRSDESGLVIWSVGPDDRDDNGPLEEENRMKDVTTVIPWPKAE